MPPDEPRPPGSFGKRGFMPLLPERMAISAPSVMQPQPGARGAARAPRKRSVQGGEAAAAAERYTAGGVWA